MGSTGVLRVAMGCVPGLPGARNIQVNHKRQRNGTRRLSKVAWGICPRLSGLISHRLDGLGYDGECPPSHLRF